MLLFLQGIFVSWESGEMIKGPVEISRSFLLSEVPVFVHAGSIITMKTDGFCE